MKTIDFSQICLPRYQIRILRRLNRCGSSLVSPHKTGNLCALGFVQEESNGTDEHGFPILTGKYCITESGVLYLGFHKNRFIESRLPIIISVIALIKACDAEIISFIKWVVSLISAV